MKNDQNLGQRLVRHEVTPVFGVLLVMIIVVSIISPYFLRFNNINSVFQNLSIVGMVTMGMALVMISGGIDLSVGWLMSLVGSSSAYTMIHFGFSNTQAFLVGIFIGVLLGSIMGFIIASTKIEPFIISLGFMSIYQGITYVITGAREIKLEPEMFVALGKTRIFNIGSPVYFFIIITVILWLVLKYTRFGRRLYAVGGNSEAAYLAGINVRWFKVGVYALNGLIVAFAALVYTSRLGTGSPLIGLNAEIDAIAAVVVGGVAMKGGKGHIWGVFIGVVLLAFISNALNLMGVSPFYQYVLKGVLIVGSVLISYYGGLRSLSSKSK